VAAAVGAFLHSLEGGCRVAGAVALAGAVLATTLLPSRPAAPAEVVELLAEPALVDIPA
jgi:hypothetical protein